MSNPFKKGDKVVENMWSGKDLHRIGVATVTGVDGQWVFVDTPSSNEYHRGASRWHFENLRTAIAGQDYPALSSHPFKVGDKVVRKAEWQRTWPLGGQLCVVTEADYYGDGSPCIRVAGSEYTWDVGRFRAAIAGQDYQVCTPGGEPPAAPSNGPLEYAPNTGHLPDGSSVQKHSAGPLYPCVIAMRDGQLGGKYDYGVISPRNQEPLWLSNHAAAVTLAETIKKDLA